MNEVETRPKKGFLGAFSKLFTTRVSFSVFFLLIIIIGSGALTLSLAKNNPKLFGLGSVSEIQVEKEKDSLIQAVSKLIALPEGEDPTFATVTDAEAVKGQPFFANAQNGDKVLIFTNAKRAVLYRPSENRIVEVGAININQNGISTPSPTPEASQSPEPTDEPSSSPSPSPTSTSEAN